MADHENAVKDCLKEMFKRVGEKYPNPELTNKNGWFTLRTWTQADEDDFRKWMKQYLKKHTLFKNRAIDTEISWFLFAWGWKVKD